MEWLYKNNYYSKTKDDSKKESHLLYNGGAIYVPEDKYYSFLKVYANDFKNNVSLHFIEQRTPIYKYMIDLDIYDLHYLNKDEIIEICSMINKIVNEYYNNPYSCIVCNCTGTPKKNKEGLIHTGIHIIWPKLYVKDNISKLLRHSIIYKFKEIKFKENWDWDSVFDKLIYEKYGFTMVGSSKLKSDRKYVPYFVLSKEGELLDDYLNRLKENYLDLMLETSLSWKTESIRTDLFEGNIPHQIPSWFEDKYKEIFQNENSEIVVPENKKNKTFTNKIGYTTAENYIQDIILNMINKYMPVYKNENCLIKGIFRYPDKEGNLLITTNSKYCQNIEREHSSCGIYFYANKNGLCQKCLCPCNKLNGRKHGLCSKYTSLYYKFEKDIEVLLFGTNRIEFKEVDETQNVEQCCDEIKKKEKTVKEENAKEGVKEEKKEPVKEAVKEKEKEKEAEKPAKPKKPKPGGVYKVGMTSEKARIDRLKEQCGQLLLKTYQLNKQTEKKQ